MSERDLFANFARMRREMDEMLGGAWGRSAYISRRASGFSPNVDVYYCITVCIAFVIARISSALKIRSSPGICWFAALISTPVKPRTTASH